MPFRIVVLAAAVRLFAGQVDDGQAITRQVSGSFLFTDPGSHHPITVWFCGRHHSPLIPPIVFVMLGDGDLADREREREATTQGTNWFARGLRFFATASEQAVALGVPLRWQLHIVHGVDHAAVPMVRAALQLLQDPDGLGKVAVSG